MDKIFSHLKEARQAMDGEMNSQEHHGEYSALDSLERALDLLALKVQAIDNSLNRVANEASCRANGIIPD